MNRKKKRRGTVLMLLGIVLLLGAATLFGYNNWTDKQANKASQYVLSQLNALIDGQQASDHPLLPDEMETVTIDGRAYIGTISIPKLNLGLPVQSDWSYPNLSVSPCRYKGNLYENSLIVISHNFNSQFGPIYQLNSGDKVLFKDIGGHIYKFAVTEVVTLDGTAVEEMESGDWDLTLFTCTYGGKQRVTVRCIRSE